MTSITIHYCPVRPVKRSIAARVAADLERDPNLTVRMVKGGLGELSVDVEGKRVFSGNRLWYPTPKAVIKNVRAAIQ